jgi:hypothetical protein
VDVEGLDAETLLSLIRTYDVALVELRTMNDCALDPLAERLRHLRTEASIAFAWQTVAECVPAGVAA